MLLSRPNEELKEHIQRVERAYHNLCSMKKVDKIIKNIIEIFANDEILCLYGDLIYKMCLDVLLLHDEGKKNKYFQSHVGNPEYRSLEYSDSDKEHSLISAYSYLHKYYIVINDLNLKGAEGRKITRKLKEIVVMFSYLISRHHGGLGNYNKGIYLKSIKDKAENCLEAFFDGYDAKVVNFFSKSTHVFFSKRVYVLTRYVYSILITCDFMAVYECCNNKRYEFNLADTTVKQCFLERLNSSKVIQSIREYQKGSYLSGVNKFRSDMFLESEASIVGGAFERLMYLEAPTGSGKSVTALNLALNLLDEEYNKVIYVAPYTNIIEQTYYDVCKFIGGNSKDVVKVSSKEEIVTDDDDMIVNFEVDFMDSLLLNYPFSIISHVKLFDVFFGCKRRQIMALSLFSNSVIVLDEIQSYKNKIWIPIINFLKEYAELLNIRIIIMSATLPKMDVLMDNTDYRITNLITNREYYYDFFKTRVELDFSLLDRMLENEECGMKMLLESIDAAASGGKRILIGTITRKTCDEIYKEMLGRYKDDGYEVYKIQGTTSVAKKNDIISVLKDMDENGTYSRKKVILVATQCVESGLDIDMQIGFKNIATLDADEQFCGRIERNFREKGKVFFFRIDTVASVYRDDYRAEKTLEVVGYRDILENKEFGKFYEGVYKWLLEKELHAYDDMKWCIRNLQFCEVSSRMNLIEDGGSVNLLMLCKYRDKYGNVIDVEEEIKAYNNIKSGCKGYAEKQVLLSRFRRVFDVFSLVVSKRDFEGIRCGGEFGIYRLVHNAKVYFTNIDEEGIVSNDSDIDLEKLLVG